MGSKVTGKNSNALAYFSSLLAIISVLGLVLFIIQIMQLSATEIYRADGLIQRLFSMPMISLQFSILGILTPAVLFCSYLSLKLKLTSRFYRVAIKVAALAMLPVFPIVSLLGLYSFWLGKNSPGDRSQEN